MFSFEVVLKSAILLLGRELWRRLLGVLFFLLCFAWIVGGMGLFFSKYPRSFFNSLVGDLLGGFFLFLAFFLLVVKVKNNI